MAEILALQQKAKYGSMKEITAVDYVDEVNKAGEGVWVVLHLYKSGYVKGDSICAWGEGVHVWCITRVGM